MLSLCAAGPSFGLSPPVCMTGFRCSCRFLVFGSLVAYCLGLSRVSLRLLCGVLLACSAILVCVRCCPGSSVSAAFFVSASVSCCSRWVSGAASPNDSQGPVRRPVLLVSDSLRSRGSPRGYFPRPCQRFRVAFPRCLFLFPCMMSLAPLCAIRPLLVPPSDCPVGRWCFLCSCSSLLSTFGSLQHRLVRLPLLSFNP